MQGDVIGLVDASGEEVASYEYDPYGDAVSATGALAETNPMRYRGYYYDAETGFYYLQSRYYDPEIGRFINADTLMATGQGIIGNNMFAYCGNNPVMLSDPNGHAPEWWQWALSGVMVVAGVVLVATGLGGAAGGALICAGANSMIGSYVSEATGGSSAAGWFGGAITGAVCGGGASFAGTLLVEATKSTGVACIGYLAASETVAFTSGAVGSLMGQGVTAAIDGKELNTKEALYSSATTGVINCISGIGAGMGSAIQGLPKINTTSSSLANSINAVWSLFAEAICDFLGTVSSIW